MTVYVIVRGLMSCSDYDEIKGYMLSEAEAKAYCVEKGALEKDLFPSRWWSYEIVEQI